MTNVRETPLELGPTLVTERLILRPPERRDFDAYAEMASDAETMRFLGGPVVRSAAWRTFVGFAGAWVMQRFGMFSVLEKSTGAWIGRIGPLQPEGWPGPEVGWGIHRRYWGKGYATEAAAASLDYVFDELGWDRVIHCIEANNEPSIRVARRLGSEKVGEANLPPPFEQVHVDLYGQTRDEWCGRQGNRDA